MTGHRCSFGRSLDAALPAARIGKPDGERGQILAMTAISLVAVCAMVAVAVDLGFFFDSRRLMQTAADNAAISGAQQLHRTLNPGQVAPAAFQGAASNGFPLGAGGTQIKVYNPPSS